MNLLREMVDELGKCSEIIIKLENQVGTLVAALQEAREGLAAWTGGEDGACADTIERIDAALAKAKGE